MLKKTKNPAKIHEKSGLSYHLNKELVLRKLLLNFPHLLLAIRCKPPVTVCKRKTKSNWKLVPINCTIFTVHQGCGAVKWLEDDFTLLTVPGISGSAEKQHGRKSWKGKIFIQRAF